MKIKPLSEEEFFARLEEAIPELSRLAFRMAYERALASGQPVTILEGDEIVEVTNAGERRVTGRLPAPPADRKKYAFREGQWKFRIR